jgi:hypothetical protein
VAQLHVVAKERFPECDVFMFGNAGKTAGNAIGFDGESKAGAKVLTVPRPGIRVERIQTALELSHQALVFQRPP